MALYIPAFSGWGWLIVPAVLGAAGVQGLPGLRAQPGSDHFLWTLLAAGLTALTAGLSAAAIFFAAFWVACSGGGCSAWRGRALWTAHHRVRAPPVRGGNALLVVLVGALAAAGCGGRGKRDFTPTAQHACANAKAQAGTTAASVAAANGRALDTVRDLAVPSGRDADVRTFVAALDRQQAALVALRDGLAHHGTAPARLRDLTSTIDVQANLVGPVARRLGAPACGTAPAALITHLQAEDYAVRIRRELQYYEHVVAELPALRRRSRARR